MRRPIAAAPLAPDADSYRSPTSGASAADSPLAGATAFSNPGLIAGTAGVRAVGTSGAADTRGFTVDVDAIVRDDVSAALGTTPAEDAASTLRNADDEGAGAGVATKAGVVTSTFDGADVGWTREIIGTEVVPATRF